MYHFKVYSSSILLVPEYFHHPKRNLWTNLTLASHSPPPTLATTDQLSVWICPFRLCHRKGIVQYLTLRVWLLSLPVVSSRSLCVVLHSFVRPAPILWHMPHLVVQPSVEGYLGHFHPSATVNSAAVNIRAPVLFEHLCSVFPGICLRGDSQLLH